MANQVIKFLDYAIINTGNGDGFVITKDIDLPARQPYECNLGNYSNLDNAKRACVFYFMMARPDVFSACLYYRLIGREGSYMEWHKLRGYLKKESITMPPSITCSNDGNDLIYYNNLPLSVI